MVYQQFTAVQATGTSISSNGITVSTQASARMTLLAMEHGVQWVGVFPDSTPPQVRLEGLAAGKRWWWHFGGKLAQGDVVADGTALDLVAPVGGVVTLFVEDTPGTLVIRSPADCGGVLGGTLGADGYCTLPVDLEQSVEVYVSQDFGVDCGGHRIRVPDAGGVFGVALIRADLPGPRLGVRNCVVENADTGIYAVAGDLEITGNEINARSGSYHGIMVIGATAPVIRSNVIGRNSSVGVGVYQEESWGGALSDNTIHAWRLGIWATTESSAQVSGPALVVSGNRINPDETLVSGGITIYRMPGLPAASVQSNTVRAQGYALGVVTPDLSDGPGDAPRIRHNNFRGGYPTVLSQGWDGTGQVPVPLEVSFAGEGNSWGRTAPPLFVAGYPGDSNDPSVVDRFPYCADNGWTLGYVPNRCTLGPPDPPVVTYPVADTVYASAVSHVTGTVTEPGTVDVRDNGEVVATAAVSAGAFSVPLFPRLGTGTHLLDVIFRRADGTESLSAAIPFAVSDVAPLTPRFTAPAAGETLRATSVVASGTAQAGVTVLLRVDGGASVSALASALGTFNAVFDGLSAGSHVVYARARDAAGNTSAETSRAFTMAPISVSAPVVAPRNGFSITALSVAPRVATYGQTPPVVVNATLVVHERGGANGNSANQVAVMGLEATVFSTATNQAVAKFADYQPVASNTAGNTQTMTLSAAWDMKTSSGTLAAPGAYGMNLKISKARIVTTPNGPRGKTGEFGLPKPGKGEGPIDCTPPVPGAPLPGTNPGPGPHGKLCRTEWIDVKEPGTTIVPDPVYTPTAVHTQCAKTNRALPPLEFSWNGAAPARGEIQVTFEGASRIPILQARARMTNIGACDPEVLPKTYGSDDRRQTDAEFCVTLLANGRYLIPEMDIPDQLVGGPYNIILQPGLSGPSQTFPCSFATDLVDRERDPDGDSRRERRDVADRIDNCPRVPNTDQRATGFIDGAGDACDRATRFLTACAPGTEPFTPGGTHLCEPPAPVVRVESSVDLAAPASLEFGIPGIGWHARIEEITGHAKLFVVNRSENCADIGGRYLISGPVGSGLAWIEMRRGDVSNGGWERARGWGVHSCWHGMPSRRR
ncbi:MAG: right-handed parallel beta-helix repeat-containing protein, partial [Deltaproteobacteria bacterium]|nr:right-handed parallel beta-helix repeat-containing protein [Deltaproteobacteria bacterium]